MSQPSELQWDLSSPTPLTPPQLELEYRQAFGIIFPYFDEITGVLFSSIDKVGLLGSLCREVVDNLMIPQLIISQYPNYPTKVLMLRYNRRIDQIISHLHHILFNIPVNGVSIRRLSSIFCEKLRDAWKLASTFSPPTPYLKLL
jgi:hypothetical protein